MDIVTNIISDGPKGTAEDLHMTYVFEWRHPEIEADSAEAKELHTKHAGRAKMAVDKSIEVSFCEMDLHWRDLAVFFLWGSLLTWIYTVD